MNETHEDNANGLTERLPERFFASWEEFKSYISADLFSKSPNPNPRYLFRGQGDAKWELQSRFERTFKSLPDFERTKRHEELRKYFVEECEHFREYEQVINHELECLALAQHHGLPTRLLDWSDSPYVAAYFAFEAHLGKDHGENNSGLDGKVAIYILDRAVESYWDGVNGVEVFRPKASGNERQKRQSGWFSLAKIPNRTIEDYVYHLGNERDSLVKAILPASVAEVALRDLKLMRISARELFADLSGAAANAFLRSVLSNS